MRRLALFAHYDAGGRVRPFIQRYLAELRTVCDAITFVSTAELGPEELDKARAHCARAFTRENVGFDFGMWRAALDGVDVDAWDEIVLTNSSVFGPVRPLREAFDGLADATCAAWGMTDNAEIAWHLQSYFLVLRKPVLRSPLFSAFFRSILPYRDKDQVIRSYEIGLSRLLLDHGFELRAFVPRDDPRLSAPVPPLAHVSQIGHWADFVARRLNPTTTFPVELLRAGMPFVKIELLRDNPWSIPLEPVLRELRASGFDLSLIEFDRPIRERGIDLRDLDRARRR